MSISPNYSQTIEFLEIFRPSGPHLLTAIPVEGGRLTTERFSSTLGVEEWCKELNTGHGLYYHVGIPYEDVSRRMNKLCVASLDHLWVDIDPTDKVSRKDILKRLVATSVPGGVPQRPTIIVDSGGGFQALWKLTQYIALPNAEAREEAERLTRHLVTAYQGDQQAWNIDRLLRLPGTINYPNTTKRKKGRVTARAQFKMIEASAADQIGFAKAPPNKFSNKDVSPSVKIKGRTLAYDSKSLPDGLGDKWTDIIVYGEESWHYGDVGYVSRSEMVLGATRFMLERGWEHQVVYDILLSSDLAISNHVLAQKDVHRYGKRQIEQCLKSMKLSSSDSTDKAEELAFIYDSPANGGTPKILKSLIHNVIVATRKLDVVCEYNELTDVMALNGKAFEDHLVTKVRSEIEDKFKVTFSQTMMKEVLFHLCQENVVNPVLEYLDNLPKWDGEKRLSNWLMDYCGAEGTKLNRAISRIILIAAVRRMRQPGCKFDEMLILEGGQGDGKSNLLGLGLVPNPDWFTDHLTMDRGSKEFMEDTFGHWIVECSELVTMKSAQIDNLKAILSRRVDKARMAYARSRIDRPRRFVIFGSTNQKQYLIDETGNRRFWPVATSGNLNNKVELLAKNRDQLWSEASEAEAINEDIRLDKSLYDAAEREQAMREIDNPFVEPISRALGDAEGVIKSHDLLNHIGIDIKEHFRSFRKLGEAMRALDFEQKQINRDGHNGKYWQRGKDDPRNDIILKYDE